MERRDFLKAVAAGSAGAVAGLAGCTRPSGGAARAQSGTGFPRATGQMVVGCQSRDINPEDLQFLARHGVYHMDPGSPQFVEGVGWDLADAQRQVEEAARYGITVQAYHLPLSSAGIDNVAFPNVMLGRSPARDREIEMLQQMIEVSGRAGVPTLLYNTIILPILRTGRTVDPTRGNASYSTWNHAEAVSRGMHEEPVTGGGADIDEIYERITYLLDRLLPVAEEYRVRLANHIADPPAPVGYRGVTRWNSPDVFAGIQRFANLYDSEYHGFNLCLGSTAEGLRNPREEIIPIIEWIGARRKIFNIHLRNIKGGWNNFQEVYPDNGAMDFVEVMQTLKNVGYDGMVMPDHVPQHEDPGARDQAFAFAYGYIKALLQVLYGYDATTTVA
jgi:mannonate dehydratase